MFWGGGVIDASRISEDQVVYASITKERFHIVSVYISCSVSNRVYNNAYTQMLYLIL